MSKEEFCADNIKAAVEKWVGTIEDMEAEFGKIDSNGGGQVRISFKAELTRPEGPRERSVVFFFMIRGITLKVAFEF